MVGHHHRGHLAPETWEALDLNFHSLDNAKTTSIDAAGFMQFLETEDHVAMLVDFDVEP